MAVRGSVPPPEPPWWSEACTDLRARDPVLGSLIDRWRGPVLASRGDAFQTLARSIVGQQISVKAAASVWARFEAAVESPDPATVACVPIDVLRGAGLSQRKAEYLLDLAARFADGRLHAGEWPRMDDEAIIDELVQVRGIGRWTAEMFLIFNLLRPDVLPVADLGLQKAISLHYRRGRSITPLALRLIAKPWAPWRSVATWYLWRSLDPEPVTY